MVLFYSFTTVICKKWEAHPNAAHVISRNVLCMAAMSLCAKTPALDVLSTLAYSWVLT